MLYFHRPENALKRAAELVAVNKHDSALSTLHDIITTRKHRQSSVLEEVLLRFIDLCVEMRRGKLAKDGLHQYRSSLHNVSMSSFETVIRHFISLSEAKADEARAQSEASGNIEEIEDLEVEATPESLLLAAVSGEDDKDRSNREVLTPWLKFLWEAYRTVLDLLRSNKFLERLYHDIARQAFHFCKRYDRKLEFRRLCDMLRNHLATIVKFNDQSNSISLLASETQNMHLETRFAQMASASDLDLWQEAFRSVEDIHGLMALGKKAPKPALMAMYYDKLSQIFWRSEQLLFHAAALHKFFSLSRAQNKSLSPTELSRLASQVVLATISIPIGITRSESDGYLDDTNLEKHKRLATILGLSAPPTREALLNALLSKGIFELVVPDLAKLYEALEVKFHPMQLCSEVQPILNFIQNDTLFAMYLPAIEDILLMRLLKQLSEVYKSMDMSQLSSLVSFRSAHAIEKFIASAVLADQLEVRIDHQKHSLNFGSHIFVSQREQVIEGPSLQSSPSIRMRDQLTVLSRRLHTAMDMIEPERLDIHEAKKKDAYALILKALPGEHRSILERKVIIEHNKEVAEKMAAQRERDEANKRDAQKKKEREAEQKRLDEESKRRETERQRQEVEDIQRRNALERVEELKKRCVAGKVFEGLSEHELSKMDAQEIFEKQIEQLDKEKRELVTRMRNIERKNDHLERAKRLEEIPLLKAAFESEKENERVQWDAKQEERIANSRLQHEKDIATKNRLLRTKEDKISLVNRIMSRRRKEFQKHNAEFEVHVTEMIEIRKEEIRLRTLREAEEKREREEKEHYEAEKAELRRIEQERVNEEKRQEQIRIAAEREAEELRKAQESAANVLREREAHERHRQQEEKRRCMLAESSSSPAPRREPQSTWERGVRTAPVSNRENSTRTDKEWRSSGGGGEREWRSGGGGGGGEREWRSGGGGGGGGEREWRSGGGCDKEFRGSAPSRRPPPSRSDQQDQWRAPASNDRLVPRQQQPRSSEPSRSEQSWDRADGGRAPVRSQRVQPQQKPSRKQDTHDSKDDDGFVSVKRR